MYLQTKTFSLVRMCHPAYPKGHFVSVSIISVMNDALTVESFAITCFKALSSNLISSRILPACLLKIINAITAHSVQVQCTLHNAQTYLLQVQSVSHSIQTVDPCIFHS